MWMLDSRQQLTSTTLAQAIEDDALFNGGKSLYMRDQRERLSQSDEQSPTADNGEMIPIFSVNAFYVETGLFQISVPSGFGEMPSLGCDISHLDANAEVYVSRQI